MASAIRIQLPKLYPKQHAAIFCSERYGVIEASTKAGKTAGCLIWLLHLALETGAPGRSYWWVAPVYSQATMAMERMARAVPVALRTVTQSPPAITLTNGAVIAFKSAEKPDNLYGDDVYGAVMDEATRAREASWIAVRSTLTATGGPVRIIGNVVGRKNYAYRLARKAEAGEPNMHYAKLTAHDAVEAGVLQAKEIEDAKRQLPKHVFRQLYLAEPADDGGNPFGLDAIAACATFQGAGYSTAQTKVYGVDLAKSQDWTWIIGLDSTGRITKSERWQTPWGETLKRLITIIGRTPALVDSTGVGDPIVEQLQKALPSVEGFKFSATSKQQLMEGLASAVQQGRVGVGPDDRTGQVLRLEMEAFEYAYSRTGVRYEAPQGLHDDGVCALALALKHSSTPTPWLV